MPGALSWTPLGSQSSADPVRRERRVRRSAPPATQQEEEQPNFLRRLAPFLGVQEYEAGDSYLDKVSRNWASNPMNPVPQTWGAISEGRAPTGGELATDAAFLAGGAVLGAAAKPVSQGIRHLRQSVRNPQAYYTSLLNRVMNDPDTALTVVRSMDSAPDIIGGSGRFQTSLTTGTSGAHAGSNVPSAYNPLREAFNTNAGYAPTDDVISGAFTSPVLRNIRPPAPLFRSGRENYLNYLQTARMLDPYDTALTYGSNNADVPRVPLRYVLGEDATNRASVTFGDSLRGAPFFENIEDFVGALNRGGYGEVMSTGGRSGTGLFSSDPRPVRIPTYIEGQVPNLTIDDVARIQSLGGNPQEAAVQGMEIADLVADAGRDIPVEGLSYRVPVRPTAGREITEQLMSRPDYQNISSSLREQRNRFVPPGMDDVVNRGYQTGGAYQRPDWATSHYLDSPGQSAVMDALRRGYQTNVQPQLESIYRFLFPEVTVPQPQSTFFGQLRNPPVL
jgi:hypothetical protein